MRKPTSYPEVDTTTLCTAIELAELHPHLTTSTIKNYAKNREYNGLSEAGAVFRLGRSLKFSPERFAAWVLANKAV